MENIILDNLDAVFVLYLLLNGRRYAYFAKYFQETLFPLPRRRSFSVHGECV